jgi:hypothetical protein
MLSIHPNARTTPAVRAEIARSSERSGILAERYGVSAETIRTIWGIQVRMLTSTRWNRAGRTRVASRDRRPHRNS